LQRKSAETARLKSTPFVIREEVAMAAEASKNVVQEAVENQMATAEHLDEIKRQHELHEMTLARTLALIVEESKKLTR
jgi:hypothetical protein